LFLNSRRYLVTAAVCAGALIVSSNLSYAVPITGILNTTGSVAVTTDMIDFLPTGGGTGDFGVDPFTQTGSFIPLAGTTGTIKDLSLVDQPVGTPFTLTDWMVFTASPNISFTLQSIPVGVFGLADCVAAPAAGQSCTPPGSPFNLSNTSATSSVVSFTTGGLVLNTLTGEVSTFDGTFSTQFTNQNLQQLLATINGGGAVQATYSANFIVSPTEVVPEPATITLTLAGGLLVLAGTLRKRKQARG
jgi:hypothetical protein